MRSLAKFAAVLLFTLATFVSAFAAQKTFTFAEDTSLAGQPLKAGEYKLDYQINGSNAELKVLKGKKVVATANGQVVQLDKRAPSTAYVRQTNSDGSSSITEFRFAGQEQAIHIAPDSGDKAGR